MKIKYIGRRTRDVVPATGAREFTVSSGDVVEVDDKTGRSLLDQPAWFERAYSGSRTVTNGTVAELKAFAAEFSIDLGAAKSKREILDVIRDIGALTDEQIAWIDNVKETD